MHDGVSCPGCHSQRVNKNGSRRGVCLGKLQQYRCRECKAGWSQPVVEELSLLRGLRFRTPAATICRVMALFGIGLSKNQIEKMTGVKGETVSNIIKRLVRSPHWEFLKKIIVNNTGISPESLHDIEYRGVELEMMGEDVLTLQGYKYRWQANRDLRSTARQAKRIMKRKICF